MQVLAPVRSCNAGVLRMPVREQPARATASTPFSDVRRDVRARPAVRGGGACSRLPLRRAHRARQLTPQSLVGQMFVTLGKYLPPPAGAQSPSRWGMRRTRRAVRRRRHHDRSDPAHSRVPLPVGSALHRGLPHLVRACATRRSARYPATVPGHSSRTSPTCWSATTGRAAGRLSCPASTSKSSSRSADACHERNRHEHPKEDHRQLALAACIVTASEARRRRDRLEREGGRDFAEAKLGTRRRSVPRYWRKSPCATVESAPPSASVDAVVAAANRAAPGRLRRRNKRPSTRPITQRSRVSRRVRRRARASPSARRRPSAGSRRVPTTTRRPRTRIGRTSAGVYAHGRTGPGWPGDAQAVDDDELGAIPPRATAGAPERGVGARLRRDQGDRRAQQPRPMPSRPRSRASGNTRAADLLLVVQSITRHLRSESRRTRGCLAAIARRWTTP